MENEVKGYQVETCFGGGGCPNQAVSSETLVKKNRRETCSKEYAGISKRKSRRPPAISP
jgi:hypothetical protein